MKKRLRAGLVGLVLAVLTTVLVAVPVMAAPPGREDWRLSGFADDIAYVYLTINPVNLQVDSFTIVNNSEKPVMLRISYNGFTEEDIIFSFTAEPGETVTEPINNFKFHRLPLTDPDDPGSIRYPNKTYIGTRYG